MWVRKCSGNFHPRAALLPLQTGTAGTEAPVQQQLQRFLDRNSCLGFNGAGMLIKGKVSRDLTLPCRTILLQVPDRTELKPTQLPQARNYYRCKITKHYRYKNHKKGLSIPYLLTHGVSHLLLALGCLEREGDPSSLH